MPEIFRHICDQSLSLNVPENFRHICDQSLSLNVPENFRHIAMLNVMFSAYFSDSSVIKMCRKFSGTFVILKKFSGTFQLLYFPLDTYFLHFLLCSIFPFTFVGHMFPTLSALLYFPLHFCRTHVSYTFCSALFSPSLL